MTLPVNLDDALEHLRLLDPDATSFTFQTIPEASVIADRHRKPKVIVGAFDEVADELVQWNARGHGIFVTCQEMDGQGRKQSNLQRIRACFIDIDARAGQKLPRKWALPANIVIETSPGSFHVWWVLADAPETGTWRGIQRRLVKTHHSDEAGCDDTAKVLRLAGFHHRKGKPHLVKIVDASTTRHTVHEMMQVYAPTAPTKRQKRQAKIERPASFADLVHVKSALKHLEATPNPKVRRLKPEHGGGTSRSYADDYTAWWTFGLALHRAFGDAGYEMWDAWSKSSVTYRPEIMRRKWASFSEADRGDDGVTIASIFYAAQRHGWRRPFVPFRLSSHQSIEFDQIGPLERHNGVSKSDEEV